MSNLAYKALQRQQQEATQQPKTKVIVTRRRSTITLGEKCLGTLFLCAVLFASIHIISNQVSIYHTNIEIQKIEASIKEQNTINNELHVQIKELSTYERIWAKAKELGLTLNEENVKVVQN